MDMLQHLGERRPKNPYIAYALGIALSGGSDEADVKRRSSGSSGRENTLMDRLCHKPTGAG